MRAHRAEQRRSKGPSVRVGHEVLPGLADWPSPSANKGGAARMLNQLGGGSTRVGSERERLLSNLCLLRAVRIIATLLPGNTRRKGFTYIQAPRLFASLALLHGCCCVETFHQAIRHAGVKLRSQLQMHSIAPLSRESTNCRNTGGAAVAQGPGLTSIDSVLRRHCITMDVLYGLPIAGGALRRYKCSRLKYGV